MALKKQYTLNVWLEGNVRTLGKTILTSFPRDHTLSALFIFRLSLKQSYGQNMLLYSVRGQQLRNFIPCGIHLNLIRGRDQESTIHSVRFVEWKSRHITIWFVSPSSYVDVGWLTSSLRFKLAPPDHMRVESPIRKNEKKMKDRHSILHGYLFCIIN